MNVFYGAFCTCVGKKGIIETLAQHSSKVKQCHPHLPTPCPHSDRHRALFRSLQSVSGSASLLTGPRSPPVLSQQLSIFCNYLLLQIDKKQKFGTHGLFLAFVSNISKPARDISFCLNFYCKLTYWDVLLAKWFVLFQFEPKSVSKPRVIKNEQRMLPHLI